MELSPGRRAEFIAWGLSPDLLVLVERVTRALPPGAVLGAEEALGRVLRQHHRSLEQTLWDAFHRAAPSAHALDGSPPRVGPVRRGMTREAVEVVLRAAFERYGVAFDGERQVGRFGPAGTAAALQDPVRDLALDVRPFLAQGGLVFVTNHPHCAGPSVAEVLQAAALNVREYHILLPTGWTWHLHRPSGDWPDGEALRPVLEQAAEWAERELRSGGAALDLQSQLGEAQDEEDSERRAWKEEQIVSFATSRAFARNLSFMIHWRRLGVILALRSPQGVLVPA